MKKKPPSEDQLPHCEHCNCGEFEPGMDLGECHLLPMDWVVTEEGGPTPMWKPARRGGWCKHFERKCH